MKTLLASLFLSLDLISTAAAHHCIGGHAGAPGCEPPAPGGIGVLRDANGATIGTIVSIRGSELQPGGGSNPVFPRVDIIFEISGYTLAARVEGGLNLCIDDPAACSTKQPGFMTQGVAYFTSTDCSGEGLILKTWLDNQRFFDSFQSPVIAFDKIVDGNFARRLYAPIDTVATSVGYNSNLFGDGCHSGPGTALVVPAILLDSDLHINYPRPYSIDLN